MMKPSSILMSAAFYKRDYTGWDDIAHRATGMKDEPHPPEHIYYVFKRRQRMEAGRTFCALPRHCKELDSFETKVEHAASLTEALAEFDKRNGGVTLQLR